MKADQTGHIKKLEWAISLCQRDLNSWRPGDWLNFTDELEDFCSLGPGRLRMGSSRPISKQTALKVQQELRKLVQTCVQMGQRPDEPASFDDVLNLPMIRVQLAGELLIRGNGSSAFRKEIQHADKIAHARYSFAAHLLDSGITAAQIKSCPECQRTFLVRRRPRADREYHCSLNCARLAATRRYRKKHASKLKTIERSRARKRYVQKQRQKFGTQVKIGKRG
jgi:hypothetical protein